MEKYVKAEMEIIEFEAEDVITTSGGSSSGSSDCSANLSFCSTKAPDDGNDDMW